MGSGGPQSTDPLYTHEGAPSSPFLPAGSDLGEREEEAGSQLKIKKERWPTPSSLHFHFLFLFLSSLQEDGGRLGIVSAFPEPLGVKEPLPWTFGAGSPGMLSSPMGRIPLRRGSGPQDEPEGRRLLRRMGVDVGSAVQAAPRIDPWGQFPFPFPLSVSLSSLSLPAAALLNILFVLLTFGDTNGTLHMDTEMHPPP